MYHPYLRGKQFELLALRNVIDKIVESGMTPIIEPVRESSRDIAKCVEMLSENNCDYIIIANPKCGELERNQLAAERVIDRIVEIDHEVELAYIVDERTSLAEIINLIENYENQIFSIVHSGRFNDPDGLLELLSSLDNFNKHIFISENSSHGYRNLFLSPTSNRILICDGFVRRARNADYENHVEEFFSELPYRYAEQGYQGFGDFLTIGNYFSEGGGQAITAAIHITYEKEDEEIYVRHFLSEPRSVPEEVPILLEEALEKLVDFLDENPEMLDWSMSCNELVEIKNGGCQTNLAYIKKLVISHHIELMHNVII